MSNLDDLKKTICKAAYGRQPDGRTCVDCGRVSMQAVNMQTEAGWREFRISGLCETCFDRTFTEDEEGGTP